MIRNPFKEVKIDEFDPHMELPPIQTLALKIHTDNAVEARFRERLKDAEEREQENNEVEGGFLSDRGRKRGFMSPLNNLNKKQVTEQQVTTLLQKFRNNENEDEQTEAVENEEMVEAGASSNHQ